MFGDSGLGLGRVDQVLDPNCLRPTHTKLCSVSYHGMTPHKFLASIWRTQEISNFLKPALQTEDQVEGRGSEV